LLSLEGRTSVLPRFSVINGLRLFDQSACLRMKVGMLRSSSS
jgi:hypothetical protein